MTTIVNIDAILSYPIMLISISEIALYLNSKKLSKLLV